MSKSKDGFESFLVASFWGALAIFLPLAALALTMPNLVIYGLYLGVLPGLILLAAPNVCLYLFSFGGFWIVTRLFMPKRLALTISVCIGAIICFGLPYYGQMQAHAFLEAKHRAPVILLGKITLSGHVRLEGRDASDPTMGGGLSCGPTCLDLLFMDGVEAVTVDHVPSYNASTGATWPPAMEIRSAALKYRLMKGASCLPRSKQAQVDLTKTAVWRGDDQRRDVVATRQMMLASGSCIVRTEADNQPVDFRIIAAEGPISGATGDNNEWTASFFEGGRLSIVEIIERSGKTILRLQETTVPSIIAPLFIMGTGSPSSYRFGLAYTAIHGKGVGPLGTGAVSVTSVLQTYTNYGANQPTRPDAQSIAVLLAAATRDLNRGTADAAFSLTKPYFFSLSGRGLNAEDIKLVSDLINDKRITNFEGLEIVRDSLGADAKLLIKPIVTRITRSKLPEDRETIARLDYFLGTLPLGAFADSNRELDNALRDVTWRRNAPTPIMRQYERGSKALPFFMDTLGKHARFVVDAQKIEEPFERMDTQKPDLKVIESVREGLCRLGPQASAALPRIEAWMGSGVLPKGVTNTEAWHFTLARLGAPVDQFVQPNPNSDYARPYQQVLAESLAQYKPDSTCK
jgi:hypothetical protein